MDSPFAKKEIEIVSPAEPHDPTALFMELLIPLAANGLPLFRQIYLGLRKAIDSGRLRPGKRLPSTRDLAEQLGVSRTVVLLAYEQLLAEGLTASRHGSGTYVVEALHLITGKEKGVSIQPRLSRFGKHAVAEAPNIHFPEGRSPALRYDFVYGGSNIELFPFEAWRRALLRNARKISIRHIDYGSSSRGVGVYGIAPYFLKQPSKAGLMIGYSRMKEAAIREGIRRFAEAL
jgi:GntR family transcriptional regulator / MocR family aminotransferase